MQSNSSQRSYSSGARKRRLSLTSIQEVQIPLQTQAHHERRQSDEISILTLGSCFGPSEGQESTQKSRPYNPQDGEERWKAFEKAQEAAFAQKKEELLEKLRGGSSVHRPDEEALVESYLSELEKERALLMEQWRAELEAEHYQRPAWLSTLGYLFRQVFDSIGSFLATTEVLLANLPLTIGAVGLSWVTMGTVWFKFMEETLDTCVVVPFYSAQCTFGEYPGCFECDVERPAYQWTLAFHYVCSFVAGLCCVMFALKVILGWKVVADELSNPTTATPMGVVCIAIECVFAGRGQVGGAIVVVTSLFHSVLGFWFLYMAFCRYGLWPDPGWFPCTVGVCYGAVKTFLYYPIPGLIILVVRALAVSHLAFHRILTVLLPLLRSRSSFSSPHSLLGT